MLNPGISRLIVFRWWGSFRCQAAHSMMKWLCFCKAYLGVGFVEDFCRLAKKQKIRPRNPPRLFVTKAPGFGAACSGV